MAKIRPLAERDLSEAHRIVRRAFGTFMGVPDLANFWTDFDYVYVRFGAEHTASCFGPLSVRPDLWNSGIAQPLVAAVSDQFERWRTHHAGLCTFPHSTKHIWLYQKFGFYPRYLTAIMAAPASSTGAPALPPEARYAALSPDERREAENASRAVAEEVYEGLDLGAEIRTAAERALGDTLLLWEGGGRLAGFAGFALGPGADDGGGGRL